MSQYHNIYELEFAEAEGGLRYFFISEGEQDVIKAIQYSYIQDFDGKRVYNLGFGDYDIATDNVDDAINTNNGDHYRILNTVLSTVPLFFETYKESLLMVHGSDSTQNFLDQCKVNCTKKCESGCKNYKRRINLYRKYVNKNYEILSIDYQFIGGVLDADGRIILEPYIVHKDYDSVLLYRKNT